MELKVYKWTIKIESCVDTPADNLELLLLCVDLGLEPRQK